MTLEEKLLEHAGHQVEIATYGLNGKPPWANVSLECIDCGCVIMDYNLEVTS